jgi:hypothetical protein
MLEERKRLVHFELERVVRAHLHELVLGHVAALDPQGARLRVKVDSQHLDREVHAQLARLGRPGRRFALDFAGGTHTQTTTRSEPPAGIVINRGHPAPDRGRGQEIADANQVVCMPAGQPRTPIVNNQQ